MSKQLSDYVYAIDVPLPGNPLRNLNSYLVKGKERNLLIDTGFNMPESYEAIMNGLDELNINIEKTDIFLTHLHSDHVGLAPSIAGTDSKIFMGSTDLKMFKNFNKKEYISRIDSIFLSFGLSKKELLENKSVNPAMIYLPEQDIDYIPVENGHVFDLGCCSLECILTPGHTPGHLCLYDRDNRIFFSGDHILFGISPNITSWFTMPDSLGSYLESLKNVRGLDVERTFSSHREIEGDLKLRVDELIVHHTDRLNEAINAVKRRKNSTVYQIASEMTWSIRAKDWAAFPVAQKWFALGETHSHLEYLRVRGIVESTINGGLIYYAPV